jgi:LPXTG-motif cell wall-anchored protein
MRKVMLLAAMLAMALAAAAPVFAQDGGDVGIVNQQADQFGVVDDSVCSQVYNIAVQQYNAGDQSANADAFADANATAGPFGTAAAAAIAGANAANIANAAGINVDTVNVCLNNFATVTSTAKTVTPKATVHAKKTVTPKAAVHAKKTATSTSTATSGGAAELPETGGASLLALGAGALLVGGGLVARRLAR